MTWLNTPPRAIIESENDIIERDYRTISAGTISAGITVTVQSRSRIVTYTREKYVGLNENSARELKAYFLAQANYEEPRIQRVDDADQFHVYATKVTYGAWSAFS